MYPYVNMELDWNKCIICQKEADEPLRCPLLGPGTNDSIVEAYTLFLENVDQFKAMNSLPTTFFLETMKVLKVLLHIMLLGTSLAI